MNDYRPYKAYTSYGDVMVAFSALKAGGFNPIFQNLHAAHVNIFEALALGGFWIFLPEQEKADAREWQNWLKKNPIKDSDSTIRKKHYWGTAFFTAFATFNIIAIPFLALGGLIDKFWNFKRKT